MSFKIITAVATEPITRAEAKLHLGIDDIGGSHPDDAIIDALITGARLYGEQYTNRALASQVLELALDEFPADEERITLPRPPVASVTSIKYTDMSGAEQTFSSANYTLSQYGDNCMIALAYDASWPSTQDVIDAVRICYVTGYAASGAGAEFTALPKAARQGLLMHISLMYPRNSLTPAERQAMEKARDELLNTIKIWGFR